ncbi:MAG: M81 family metallopeptidase [Candidatus Lambdaproteobacteria bacterium]|nr:M81 family metallopeptidase [Candidatus Lambdaproteobacteria bacterium]
MHLLIAMLKHETNTFSPLRTDLTRFGQRALYYGDEARRAFAGTSTAMGAFLELAAEAHAETVTPVAADAMPSGAVDADAYEHLSETILKAVRRGCDALLLDLHGAMVAQGAPDGEGTLLRRIRDIAPEVPIAVTLDMHANLTDEMVRHCNIITGYKTYPHVDPYDVALQGGRILLRMLRGEVRPVMTWGALPLLAQTLRMGTDDEPMGTLASLSRQMEREPVLAATVFGGFPMADFAQAGVSAVVVTDNDPLAAARVRDALLDAAWAARDEFIYRGEPLHQAVARAKGLKQGPVILLDHADNCASGGTQDVMTVLAEVLSQGLQDVAVGGIWDPAAVKQMAAAGVGAQVTLDLGGKTDMPSIGRKGESLRVTGRVRALTDGEYIITGPMKTGVRTSMGPSAVLDTGPVQIVVISYHHEPWDLGLFTSVGIDPRTKHYLLLKSRIHYRAGFAPIARHTVLCDGIGVTSSDNALFRYERVRRPIYPLDAVTRPRG